MLTESTITIEQENTICKIVESSDLYKAANLPPIISQSKSDILKITKAILDLPDFGVNDYQRILTYYVPVALWLQEQIRLGPKSLSN
jgi:hypothetical protein